MANNFFMALSRTASHGKHALPVFHPRNVLEVPGLLNIAPTSTSVGSVAITITTYLAHAPKQ